VVCLCVGDGLHRRESQVTPSRRKRADIAINNPERHPPGRILVVASGEIRPFQLPHCAPYDIPANSFPFHHPHDHDRLARPDGHLRAEAGGAGAEALLAKGHDDRKMCQRATRAHPWVAKGLREVLVVVSLAGEPLKLCVLIVNRALLLLVGQIRGP
jgi:hypothetical protein